MSRNRSQNPAVLQRNGIPDAFRRMLLWGLASMPLWCAHGAQASDVVKLTWSDLRPEGERVIPDVLQGLIEHDDAPLFSQQPPSSGVRTDWNGQIVELAGYIVPIDYKGSGIVAFILVPYVGACVHVPPPPANQLVMVTTAEPFESKGLFEAVNVTGMFGVSSVSTQLADIGYALSADKIEPFKY